MGDTRVGIMAESIFRNHFPETDATRTPSERVTSMIRLGQIDHARKWGHYAGYHGLASGRGEMETLREELLMMARNPSIYGC